MKREQSRILLKFFILTVLFVNALVLGASPAAAFKGGDGSEGDPYQIATTDQLATVAEAAYLDKHFILVEDINLNVAPFNTGDGWEPIGTLGDAFTGGFDGDGNTISNLFIDRKTTSRVGLFGSTDGAKLTSIQLEDVDVTGQTGVGSLVGRADNSTISNSHATGDVTGLNHHVGGLVGSMEDSTISDSHSTSTVEGTGDNIGGLVGHANNIIISNSYATGDVEGTTRVGGLVGYLFGNSDISDSHATGNVEGTGNNVGGLMGLADNSTISNSYATGNVESTSNGVGGLVGRTGDSTINESYSTGDVEGMNRVGGLAGDPLNGEINDSYALGEVKGEDMVGGLVGRGQNLSLTDSYATGQVSGNEQVGGLVGRAIQNSEINYTYSVGEVAGVTNIGGLVGFLDDSTVTASYYNTETSGQSDTGKGEPKDTAEMMLTEIFENWDFDTVWSIEKGASYPFLENNPPDRNPSPFDYEQIGGTGDARITGYQGIGGNVTIPGTINGWTVTEIEDSAFDSRSLSSVTIPDGITKIGSHAFASNQLVSVTIPASVLEVGSHAFANNQLTEITMEREDTVIGDFMLTDNNLFRTAYEAGGAGTYTGTQTDEWTRVVNEPIVDPPSFKVAGITDKAAVLVWDKATDNFTPQEELLYSIYYSTTPMTDLASIESGNLYLSDEADIDNTLLEDLMFNRQYYFGVVVENNAGYKSYMITSANTSTGAPWTSVGEAGFTDGTINNTSLQIHDGKPYLAYMETFKDNEAVLVKYNPQEGWQMVGDGPLSSGGASGISLYITDDGTPYVAYNDYDYDHKASVVTLNEQGNWTYVGSPGFTGNMVSNITLIVDNGTPWLSYTDNSTLHRATLKKYDSDTDTWVTLGSPDGYSPSNVASLSMTIIDGVPYTAFSSLEPQPNNRRLTIMTYQNGFWQNVSTSGIESSFVESAVSITSYYDGQNELPIVAYGDFNNSGRMTVIKLDADTDSWVTVGEPGFMPKNNVFRSRLANHQGDFYLSHSGMHEREATVMNWTGERWASVGQSDFSAGNASDLVLAMDSLTGTPYVAYRDDGNGARATVKMFIPDTEPPYVEEIVRHDPQDEQITDDSVTFRVVFNEIVDRVNVNDFELYTTGTAAGDIISLSEVDSKTYDINLENLTGTGTIRIDLISAGSAIEDTSGNLLTADFMGGEEYKIVGDPIIYTVTFDKNSGDAEADPQTLQVASGKTADALPQQPTKDGYIFQEWNKEQDGSDSEFTTDTPVTADITVYAIWEQVQVTTFTVTYDGNENTGGAVPIDNNIYQAGDPVTVIDNTNDLVRSGYRFADWNTAADGSGTSYATNDTFTITEDVTLYAQWDRRTATPRSSTTPAPVETPEPEPDSGAPVIINQQKHTAGKETVTETEGRRTAELRMDPDLLQERIQHVLDEKEESEIITVNVIDIPTGTVDIDTIRTSLTGDVVKTMEENRFIVNIMAQDITYTIPAEEIGIDQVSSTLGVDPDSLRDIEVDIEVEKATQEQSDEIAEQGRNLGYETLVPPVQFRLMARTTTAEGEEKETSVSRFKSYVSATLKVPEEADSRRITTGVFCNPDGVFSHVPTNVYFEDGKWHARMNTLSHSTYTLIENLVTVDSVAGHWSEQQLNDMASRLVIDNPDSFLPDEQITRADFADYITKALGLFKTGIAEEGLFTDVELYSERADAITVAADYGIILGYPDGTFHPDASISREEAMTMYARAMDLAGLEEADYSIIERFADKEEIADWAFESVQKTVGAGIFEGRTNETIDPKGTFTYAEAATAVRNLLLRVELINDIIE